MQGVFFSVIGAVWGYWPLRPEIAVFGPLAAPGAFGVSLPYRGLPRPTQPCWAASWGRFSRPSCTPLGWPVGRGVPGRGGRAVDYLLFLLRPSRYAPSNSLSLIDKLRYALRRFCSSSVKLLSRSGFVLKSKKSERLIFNPAQSFSSVGIVGHVFRKKQLLRLEYGTPDAFASLYIDQ